MPPQFIYFDLGKVLLDFSGERMFRQIAEVAGIEPAAVQEAVFRTGLQEQYEAGQITGPQFYEIFCQETGTRADYQALRRAGSDIFELNCSIVPVVSQLHRTGHRLGILSNTCESHWEHCLAHYSILELFSVHALSFRIKSAKPDGAIFRAAAEMAGVEPQDIFYTDDLPQHVEGARAVGFDAVQYTSTPQLVADLRAREVDFNY